jgi:endo-1,4-beta-xylanase
VARCRWAAVAGVALALLSGPAAARSDAAPARRAAPEHTLITPPAPRRVQLGTAVRLAALRSDGRYRETFLREFDALTPENEMKMQALQPRPGVFDFSAADELVAFAAEHGKRVRGHALVWSLQLPLWLVERGMTHDIGLKLPPLAAPSLGAAAGGLLSAATGWRREELLATMRRHIDTVVRHFADDVLEWDVVNEPLAADGGLADSVWRRFIGDDYVEQALRFARAANPRARLFINEYGVEGPGAKLDGLVALVRDLRARNVPLDGVGLQTHTHIEGFHDEATLRATMRRLAALGVELQITEMDVGTSLIGGTVAGERLERQAAAYGAAARACRAVRACTRLTTWGFTDRYSWLGPAEMALPFDARLRPKPAYDAIRSALRGRSARDARRLRRVLRTPGRRRVGVRQAAGPA